MLLRDDGDNMPSNMLSTYGQLYNMAYGTTKALVVQDMFGKVVGVFYGFKKKEVKNIIENNMSDFDRKTGAKYKISSVTVYAETKG